MTDWISKQVRDGRAAWQTSQQRRLWRNAVRPRGREVVDWMYTQRGPVRLSDDDAVAVAEYARWIEGLGHGGGGGDGGWGDGGGGD